MSSDSNSFVLKRIGTYDLTGNRLGKGNFAYVELATNRITKSKVAMKVIDTRKIKDDYVKKNILREALLLKKVNHPNIVRLYETLKQHSIYCIVTEYVPGGELLTHLRSQHESKLSESQARPIMRQLISALYHMHENGIVHRDLKMENILLDESKKNIKIVDFGLSNTVQGDDLLKTQCGSPEYAAPELFRRGCQYGTEVDLWSLGVVMYGIVAGRLPFRSPHYGSKGRSELLDQTSRGLSCAHNKYLVLLTPHCRDLLRKLLEPNPQMRLPLLDVMVHPWVTAHGTAPLMPYTEQPINKEVRDKALRKTSELISMDKAKIAFHVRQKRYDAISGVYNLLLDEERKKACSLNKCDEGIRSTEDQGASIIRVFINTASNDGKESGSHSNDSESTTSSASPDSQTEHDWEQAPTRKHMVHKPNVDKPIKRYLEPQHLRIRGRRICSTEPKFNRRNSLTRTRPNTAEGRRAQEETLSSRKQIRGVSRPWQKTGKTRCKSCIPRFTPKFDSELRVRQVVMSPRVRQEIKPLELETKIQTLISEKDKDGGGRSEEDAKPGVSVADEISARSTQVARDIQTKKSDENLKRESNTEISKITECASTWSTLLSGTSGENQNTESATSDDKITAQMLQTNPKFSSPRNSVRPLKSGSKISPSSLAQTSSRAVSPLKRSQFVDLADYHKYVPQPPQSRTAVQRGPFRLATTKDEKEGKCYSFSVTEQSYTKNSKPQHLRLSIMQAQEILQHESKFQAKYGRRLSTEELALNSDSRKQPETQVSRFGHASTVTPSSSPALKKAYNQYSIPRPGYLKGATLLKDQREFLVCGIKREETVYEKQDETSHSQLVGSRPSVERNLPDNHPINDELDNVGVGIDFHSSINQDSRMTETLLQPKQEESLKRQKEKEQLENRERERAKFLKELEDQERKKIIAEYLKQVYSQHGSSVTNISSKISEFDTRSKQRRAHSVPRPVDRQSSDVPQVNSKPVPILYQATRGSPQGDKRIAFRAPNETKAAKGVRFFNEWINSVFTEYINGPDGNATMGKEQDKRNMNDASCWMEQHLNGVLDETTVRRGLLHHNQFIPRET